MGPLTWANMGRCRSAVHTLTPLHGPHDRNGKEEWTLFLCCSQPPLIRHFDFSFTFRFSAYRCERVKENEITYQIEWTARSAKPVQTYITHMVNESLILSMSGWNEPNWNKSKCYLKIHSSQTIYINISLFSFIIVISCYFCFRFFIVWFPLQFALV